MPMGTDPTKYDARMTENMRLCYMYSTGGHLTSRQISAVLLEKHDITLGYSAVQHLLKAAKKAFVLPQMEEMRNAELERLNYLDEVLAPKVASGYVPAVREAREISDRRSKLMGLDIPVSISINQTLTIQDTVEREMAELSRELGIVETVG